MRIVVSYLAAWARISLLALFVGALLFLAPSDTSAQEGPNTPDGTAIEVCVVEQVNVGAGGTPSVNPQTVQPCSGASGTGIGKQTFNPVLAASLADPTPGAKSDVITSFNLPKGDANFAATVGFSPPGLFVAAAADVPLAAEVGTLSAGATLGLINGACANLIQFDFTFFNASIDINDTIDALPFVTNNKPTADRLKNLAGSIDGDFIADGIQQYPSFLKELFGNLQPRARYFGMTIPPFRQDISLTVILQFIVFEPGAQIPASDLIPDPPSFDPSLGNPIVTVLLDPTAPATISPVTDFCSPLTSSTTIFGVSKDNPITPAVEPPATVRQNPSGDVTLNFVTFAVSQRDADGDGFENALDTCPFTPNQQDARDSSAVDPDGEGIDNACDPDPTALCYPGAQGAQSFDCDGDEWLNRGDNCPQEPNADQADGDNDGIGDVCDIAPDADGDGVPDPVDECPGTASGATVDANGCSDAQLETQAEEEKEETKKELLETLTVGMNLDVVSDTVAVGGSTDVLAICAEIVNDLKPISGVDVTFKIDSQPGSDADLDGQAEVTKTSDAEGVAEVTLNVGTTAGKIVVSATADNCGTKTVTITVGLALEETSGPSGGAATGLGSLAPAVASIPAWAAIASGLGAAGLLGSLGAIASRILRRRRQ